MNMVQGCWRDGPSLVGITASGSRDSLTESDEVFVDLHMLLLAAMAYLSRSRAPGRKRAVPSPVADALRLPPQDGDDDPREDLIDALMSLEARSLTRHWSVLVTCTFGTASVNGVYADPIEALAAADRLAAELGAVAGSEGDDTSPWTVRVIPYFPPAPSSGW
jgi:hypothetical protein